VKTDTQIDGAAASAPSLAVSIFERLSDVSKLIALTLGTLYVIGLLIVNIELGRYGVFSAGLDRPEYVLAGALWAFLSILPILVYYEYRTLISSPKSVKDVKAICKALPFCCIGILRN